MDWAEFSLPRGQQVSPVYTLGYTLSHVDCPSVSESCESCRVSVLAELVLFLGFSGRNGGTRELALTGDFWGQGLKLLIVEVSLKGQLLGRSWRTQTNNETGLSPWN